MPNTPYTQSQKRSLEAIASLFQETGAVQSDFLFLKSSSDVGVERNGGRNGACFAPRSFLSYFKKLALRPGLAGRRMCEAEVADGEAERKNFPRAQEAEARRIGELVRAHPGALLCHLGGGHDHIYPLLTALGKRAAKVVVINVDAHADTRTDEEAHSGTPFRQFAETYSGDFYLYQVGLLESANTFSTLSPLPRAREEILWRHELDVPEKVAEFFRCIRGQVDEQTTVVFSLDADALDGAEVPGVSAVNGDGLNRKELMSLWRAYQALPLAHAPVLGIYELNPVYDSISMLSMRTLGGFVYEIL